jgi:hypothetical protein
MRGEAGCTGEEGSPVGGGASGDELHCALFGLGSRVLCRDGFSAGAAAHGCGVGGSTSSDSVLLSSVSCGVEARCWDC